MLKEVNESLFSSMGLLRYEIWKGALHESVGRFCIPRNVAQLVEHLSYTQQVPGSIPGVPILIQIRSRGGEMPRARSPKRDEAYQLWLASEGKKKLKDIAADLGVSETQVRKWKNQDKWNGNVTNQAKGNVTKRKRGGQPGNKNSVGHGAPRGNQNATKHGLFSRYLPEDTREIFFSLDSEDPLDLLWDQIKLAYTAIVRAQQIMHVRDQDDMTKEEISSFDNGYTYSVQQAWDKQASFLQAQAKAQKELTTMIKQYEELLHKNWDLATKEQKARIKQLKARTEQIQGTDQNPIENKVKKLFDAIGGALDETE